MKRNKRRPLSGGRFNKILSIALCLFSIGVFSAAGFFIRQSGILELKDVVFYGNSYLSDKELRGMMGVKSVSIFTPLGRIAGRLQASPWIKEAMLRKEYPKLTVKVKEAMPVAFLNNGKGGSFLISSEGMMLEKIESPVPFLPVIHGDFGRENEAFMEAVRLAGVVKETGLSVERNSVKITGLENGAENLTLAIEGLPVKVGKGQYEEKLLRLVELSEEIKKREINVDFIDLRFANRVVVKAVSEVRR